jgi:hypothetical protein
MGEANINIIAFRPLTTIAFRKMKLRVDIDLQRGTWRTEDIPKEGLTLNEVGVQCTVLTGR